MDGIINVLKPPGMTSHNVVAFIRRLFKEKKVGHTGTLDPGVAGVLPLGLGKGTKVTHFLLDSDKAYRAEITFGITTDTQDGFGPVTAEKDASYVNEELVRETLARFVGELSQVPPMTSAVRFEGKKLYELARKGIVVEPEPRKVKIIALDLIRFYDNGPNPRAVFDVTCSKGTYVRTLCHEIGQDLGCGAYMSFLIRTRSGPFTIYESKTLEELKSLVDNNRMEDALLPIDAAIPQLPQVKLDESAEMAVLHGNEITVKLEDINNLEKFIPGQLARLSDFKGLLLAIAEIKKTGNGYCSFQPVRVLKGE